MINVFFLLPPDRNVFWNETGNLVCLATDDCYFILKVDTGAIAAAIETKSGVGEDGLEEAFDVSWMPSKSIWNLKLFSPSSLERVFLITINYRL